MEDSLYRLRKCYFTPQFYEKSAFQPIAASTDSNAQPLLLLFSCECPMVFIASSKAAKIKY
jgi:hypothetical protein